MKDVNEVKNHATNEPDRCPTKSKQAWLNIKEAAAYLGRSKQTLYNWISQGNGPRRKKEYGRWYFLVADLESHRRANSRINEAFQ
jgi:hypothetical protein